MKYDDNKVKTPYLTVDSVVMEKGKILLVKRKGNPFVGYWALPGGFMERGETLRKAAPREVLEETGMKVSIEKMIAIYDDPKRNPMGHAVTVTFLCKVTGGKLRPQEEEVSETRFFSIPEISKLKLAFDHRRIIRDALKMRSGKA
jgi:8-oxo-dGTP diphosphatase